MTHEELYQYMSRIPGSEHTKRAIQAALTEGYSLQFIGSPLTEVEALASTCRTLSDDAFGSPANCRGVLPRPRGFHGHPGSWCTCSVKTVARWQAQWFHLKYEYNITFDAPDVVLDTLYNFACSWYQ